MYYVDTFNDVQRALYFAMLENEMISYSLISKKNAYNKEFCKQAKGVFTSTPAYVFGGVTITSVNFKEGICCFKGSAFSSVSKQNMSKYNQCMDIMDLIGLIIRTPRTYVTNLSKLKNWRYFKEGSLRSTCGNQIYDGTCVISINDNSTETERTVANTMKMKHSYSYSLCSKKSAYNVEYCKHGKELFPRINNGMFKCRTIVSVDFSRNVCDFGNGVCLPIPNVVDSVLNRLFYTISNFDILKDWQGFVD